jgi:hypothetical protein
MNDKQMIRYKIGLLVIGLFTLGLLIWLLVQAGPTRQDVRTDKLANDMADSLNNYTDSNFAIPATLAQAGIHKSSPYISYTKLSDSKYKFCVTYKTTSSDFDPSAAVDNVLTTGMEGAAILPGDTIDTSSDFNSDLYIPTSHHKGVNCQTVDIGTDGSGSVGCDSLPVSDSSTLEDNLCSAPIGDYGSGDGTSDANLTPEDSQRETDIDALDAHLEALYALNGYYPTLAEVNSASWRSTNMQGLDASAVCDPSASSTTNCQVVSSPQKSAYSYQVLDGDGHNCTNDQDCMSFTLTATLSTGKQFAKQSNV